MGWGSAIGTVIGVSLVLKSMKMMEQKPSKRVIKTKKIKIKW